MKKVLLSLMIIILGITLIGCTKEKTDAEKFKEEYESINNELNEEDNNKYRELSIDKDNPFIYSNAEEITIKIDNKETFIVYFGFKECPWCRSVIEQLIKSAKNNNVDTIYYVDVTGIRDVKEVDEDGQIKTTKEGSKAYLKLLDQMKDVLEDYDLTDKDDNPVEVGEKRIYAPSVVAVSKGKAIQLETGISDALKDPYDKLTDKINKYAYNKFKCLFDCLEAESTTCQKNSC